MSTTVLVPSKGWGSRYIHVSWDIISIKSKHLSQGWPVIHALHLSNSRETWKMPLHILSRKLLHFPPAALSPPPPSPTATSSPCSLLILLPLVLFLFPFLLLILFSVITPHSTLPLPSAPKASFSSCFSFCYFCSLPVHTSPLAHPRL